MKNQAQGRALNARYKQMPKGRVQLTQNEKLRRLEKQAAKFIKAELNEKAFTEDLYRALTDECGLNPGHGIRDFFQVRFRQEAQRTADILETAVPKDILKPLCRRLAEAIQSRMRQVPGTDRTTIEPLPPTITEPTNETRGAPWAKKN